MTRPLIVPNPAKITGYFRDRFGIPEDIFDTYLFLENTKNVWATKGTDDLESLLSLKLFQFAGMHILRRIHQYYKPTSYGLQQFGGHASRNVVQLNRFELRGLLEHGILPLGKSPDAEPGYVILSYHGQPLGCGIYREGTLAHSFPKGRSIALAGSGLY